jgi:hypothetical protein
MGGKEESFNAYQVNVRIRLDDYNWRISEHPRFREEASQLYKRLCVLSTIMFNARQQLDNLWRVLTALP